MIVEAEISAINPGSLKTIKIKNVDVPVKIKARGYYLISKIVYENPEQDLDPSNNIKISSRLYKFKK